MNFRVLKKTDPELFRLIRAELLRQRETIDLIPSENILPPALLELVGSPLINKYSEGYPGKRYYPGNAIYDAIENLAKTRALKAFALSPAKWSVNVQPYSGSPANLAIYTALAKPGETILGMELAAGGHLTHGHKVSASGKFWKAVQYGVNKNTGLIDYEEVQRLAKKHKPKIIISGITAYSRIVDFKTFGAIARSVGASHVADVSHLAGLIAAGAHPSPFPHADVVMTTTHKSLRGPRGAVIFSRRERADALDRAVFPGLQGGPHNNVTAAVASMFKEARTPAFRRYGKQIVRNARALALALMKEGFRLATNGTDNHMMLLDAHAVGLDGLAAERLLEEARIMANRNSLSQDASPFRPSGIRLGTPAVTTRGMKEPDMKKVASWIRRILIDHHEPRDVGREVTSFLKRFPLPY